MKNNNVGDRPVDGATKTDQAGCAWVACCGVWYSEDAWTPPQVDVERDPEEAARTHRVLPKDTTNCPDCGCSLRRHEVVEVDAERVLAIAEAIDEPGREAAYAQRLRDTQEGTWIRFGPALIAPGARQRIPVSVVEVVENVAFLSLPLDVARFVRVTDLQIGMQSFIDGPIPGECFAVRIPADARRPIDRGGSFGRAATIYPALPVYVTLENFSCAPVQAIGALFAPRTTKLSIVGGVQVGVEAGPKGCY